METNIKITLFKTINIAVQAEIGDYVQLPVTHIIWPIKQDVERMRLEP